MKTTKKERIAAFYLIGVLSAGTVYRFFLHPDARGSSLSTFTGGFLLGAQGVAASSVYKGDSPQKVLVKTLLGGPLVGVGLGFSIGRLHNMYRTREVQLTNQRPK